VILEVVRIFHEQMSSRFDLSQVFPIKPYESRLTTNICENKKIIAIIGAFSGGGLGISLVSLGPQAAYAGAWN
jgi:hypothetical protein